MIDFNYRFQKTWDSIPAAVKPTPSNGFLHYLRALNSNISTTLKSTRGVTFPTTYEISIRVENILI